MYLRASCALCRRAFREALFRLLAGFFEILRQRERERAWSVSSVDCWFVESSFLFSGMPEFEASNEQLGITIVVSWVSYI